MIIGVILFMAALMGGILIWQFLTNSGAKEVQPLKSPVEYGLYKSEIKALDQFVTTHFMKSGLVQTTLQATEQGEKASGEDLLSESVGLMLLYYIKTNQEEAFKSHLELANSLLQKDNGLYQWRYRYGQNIAVSASVDDLRIAKALMMASDKWGDENLKGQAQALSKALIDQCTKEHKLLSYDDASAEEAPPFYYDFKAMSMLSTFDSEWTIIMNYGLETLSKNKVESAPLYWSDPTDNNAFKMVENTLIAMYLSEVGKLSENDLAWYKKQLSQGRVIAAYNRDGTAATDIESPAIYGIIAQIAKNENNRALYTKTCGKLKSMQHLEKDSDYGGFVDMKSQDAYSFDQLMSLLGY